MVVRRLAIAIGALTACGGVVSEAPSGDDAGAPRFAATDYSSGARLRAKTYRSAEGASIFHGWFDSKLGLECAFAIAEDGVLRCLPKFPAYGIAYSDAACTEPSVIVSRYGDPEPPGPRYGLATTCAGTRVFLGADLITTTPKIYSFDWNGSCMSGYYGIQRSYGIAQPVDASTFVGASVITKAVDSGVAARVLVADDGARATLSAYDVAHADDCDLGDPTLNVTSICAPVQTTSVTQMCQPDVPVAPACANAVPPALRSQNGCTASATIAVEVMPSCFFGDQRITVAPGAPFDAPNLAQADQGTARLRVRWVTSTNGSPIRVAGFYDSLLETPCHAAYAGGVLRCVPDDSNVWSGGPFIDGCVDPAIQADPCSIPRFGVGLHNQWYVRAAPLEIGAQVCGGAYGCVCTPYDRSTPLYRGTPIPIDTFAPVDDVTE